MKKTVVAVSLVCAGAFSCSNDDKNESSGPAVNTPGLDLVAGNFKNTAKDGKEVGAKLKSSADSFSTTKFAAAKKSYTNLSGQENSILNSRAVANFLDMHAEPTGRTLDLPVSEQGDCGKSLSTVDSVYQQTGSVLRGLAEQLMTVEQNLPDGIVATGPTDQFAVTYQIDLSKMTVKADQDQAAREAERLNVSGIAKIGAGADAESAVVALGANGSAQGKEGNLGFATNFATSINDTLKLLKLDASGDLSLTVKDESGRPQQAALKYKSLLELVAGVKPTIHLSANVSGNGAVSSEGASLSNEAHNVSIDLTLTEVSAKEVSVSYTFVNDGQSQTGKQTYQIDQTGGCAVQQQMPVAQ